MKRIFFITILTFFTLSLWSQTINDAIRYSMYEVGGTARMVAVGGAMGALGADFSAASLNPAGIASYRRSEFVFTPTLVFSTTKAELEGLQNQLSKRTKTNFNFNAIGMVIAKKPVASKWSTSNFAIGVNRVANFNQKFYYEGTSPSSITDRFLELASGLSPDQLDGFEAGLGYDAGAIYDDGNGGYTSDFFVGEEVNKSQQVTRRGSINELAFSFAGNLAEKVMIGGTLGIPFLNFEESKIYMETDEDDLNPVFDELTFREELTTSGVGINLKIGAIYRLNQAIRIGGAVHTPTAFALEDNFTTILNYLFTDPNFPPEGEQRSPDLIFEYRYKTPWRLIGSAGVIIKKYGFLSAEVEWLDYGGSKFKFNNTDDPGDLAFLDRLNGEIATELTGTLNIRLGGEFAYNKLRFRAGYAMTGTPYAVSDDIHNSMSLGAGLRFTDFFMDFAFRRTLNEVVFQPYLVNAQGLQPEVATEDLRNQFMWTLGFKF